jgi:hypothetical protein
MDNISITIRKNMNYIEVFNDLSKYYLAIPYPRDSVPYGKQLYDLGHEQRVTIMTLRLNCQHKQRSPIVRVFDGTPLVCRVFYSDENKHSVLYCAWLETKPNFVMLWERNRDKGICIELLSSRFVKVSIESLSHIFNLVEISQDVVEEETDNVEISESFVKILKLIARDVLKEVDDTLLVVDSVYDPLGDFVSLRRVFSKLRNEFESMLACRMCNARNMDKVLLTKFKASWEETLHFVKTYNLDGVIPRTEWHIAMWLFVIGCPERVRTCDDFMYVICTTIIRLEYFEEEHFIGSLCNEGFSVILSKWLYITIRDHIDFFEEELQNIAEPVSWNSYLCEANGKLCYTHSHPQDKDNGVYDSMAPTEVILSICDETGIYEKIVPKSLNLNEGQQWYPITYANEVFEHMKKSLNNDETKCFYGHCCSEQSIVKMSKGGISHLCSYENQSSCGHGMYFFRMDSTCLSRPFVDLCRGACDCEEAGRQFQGFIYALTRTFESRKCHALSPAVLLVLVNKDFSEVFNTTTTYLPTVDNGDSQSGWRCSCKRATEEFTFHDTCVTVSNKAPCALDVKNALQIMPLDIEDRCEKYNAIAMMSGIVDYAGVKEGILTGNVCDNSCSHKRMPLKTLKSWGTSNEYDKWKQFLTVDVSAFRRRRLLFDYNGKFIDSRGYRLNKPGLDIWDEFPTHSVHGTIPVPEYIFISSGALKALFSNSISISVAFINPDESFYPRHDICHSIEDTSSQISPESVTTGNMNKRHPYWKLRIECRQSHEL